MTAIRLLLLGLAVTLAGCDSFAGALDPDTPGSATGAIPADKGRLTLVNGSAHTITHVYTDPCNLSPGGATTSSGVDIDPGESWSKDLPPACHDIDLELGNGSYWSTQRTLTAGVATLVHVN